MIARLLAVLVFTAALSAEEPLRLTVESGYYQFEPATIRLRVRVERDQANRLLRVGLVGDGFETSSDEDLPGEQAPLTRWVTFKGVPGGEYAAVAVLVRNVGKPFVAREQVQVLSRN